MKTTTAIIITGVIIGIIIVLFIGRNAEPAQQENIQNVSIVDGKQIIEIKAKGGYTPRVSIAKSGIPTILRFDTKGTFDCSASVRIPSVNVSEILPNSGTRNVDIGLPEAGTLKGSCGMGMYPFQINFQ